MQQNRSTWWISAAPLSGVLALLICGSLSWAQAPAADQSDESESDPAEQDVLDMNLEELSQADVVVANTLDGTQMQREAYTTIAGIF